MEAEDGDQGLLDKVFGSSEEAAEAGAMRRSSRTPGAFALGMVMILSLALARVTTVARVPRGWVELRSGSGSGSGSELS